MRMIVRRLGITVMGVPLVLAACGQTKDVQTGAGNVPAEATKTAPQSLQMGGAKSVTRFFVTSKGLGRGGNLGGLAGADAHCQALAKAEGAGDHTWRAYLSTMATKTEPAVNAHDRIGSGPWYNSGGVLIAATIAQLHGTESGINKENAVTERLDPVNGVGDTVDYQSLVFPRNAGTSSTCAVAGGACQPFDVVITYG